MKLSEISDTHLSLADRNILADVVVLVDGKELAIVAKREVTERGKTRVVLVPSKPRASRAKSTDAPKEMLRGPYVYESGTKPASVDGLLQADEYASQGVNLTPMLSQADDYRNHPYMERLVKEEGVEDGVITDTD